MEVKKIEVPIRKGYTIDEGKTEHLKVLTEYQTKGFVDIKEIYVIECSKCGNSLVINDSVRASGFIDCPRCNKTTKSFSGSRRTVEIAQINYKKILNHLDKLLKDTFGEGNVTWDGQDRCWIIRTNGKTLPVFLWGVSTNNAFLSLVGNNGLFFYLDRPGILNQIHELNKFRFVNVNDSLIENSSEFTKLVDSLDCKEAMNYIKLRDKFSAFIDKISPTDFEKKFIQQFVEGMKKNHNELEKLYTRLTIRDNSLLNCKFVAIGGAGQEDFYTINLLEYIQNGLKPEKYGEAKRYYTTKLDFQRFSVAIAHAVGGETLTFVSTDDISSEVWSNIVDTKQKYGKYNNVLIDRDLILLLISALGLENLIDAG